MWWSLKPLLDGLGYGGLSYKWGHPFQLFVQNGNHAFSLKHPSELPAFEFRDETHSGSQWLALSTTSLPLCQKPLVETEGDYIMLDKNCSDSWGGVQV